MEIDFRHVRAHSAIHATIEKSRKLIVKQRYVDAALLHHLSVHFIPRKSAVLLQVLVIADCVGKVFSMFKSTEDVSGYKCFM